MVQSDRDLCEHVRQELQRAPSVDAVAIEVFVDDGVVILSGRVGSAGEREAARRAALRVLGVQDLANEIRV